MLSAKLLFVSFLASLGNALATGNLSVVPDEKYALITVYMCNEANWEGVCLHLSFLAGWCSDLGGGWNNEIVSLGPDQDAGVCVVYKTLDCVPTMESEPAFLAVAYPGLPDLASNPGFNKAINSIMCSG